MNPTTFGKSSGVSLIIGSFLFIVTMILHPVGGTIEQIQQRAVIAIVAHSLAILSLPFVAFGFYGLALALESKGRLSFLAFVIACFGLVAVMIAAAINGLTLPFYVLHNSDDIAQNLPAAKLIIRYGSSFNKAMDFIFIAGLGLAIALWSFLLVLRQERLVKWLGFYGFFLVCIGILAAFAQYNFIHLGSFRLVVFGIASWIIGVAVLLTKNWNVSGSSQHSTPTNP